MYGIVSCIGNQHAWTGWDKFPPPDTLCDCKKVTWKQEQSNYMSIPKITQLPLDFLSNSFQVKPQTKTFKTKPKDGATLEECFKTANEFIRANSEGYTRIEFPFDNYYYVIAKLNSSEGEVK